jgi:hypothetical protein
MNDHIDTFGGPHFDPGLIGPNGRLSRLHKGPKPKGPSPSQIALEKKQLQLANAQLAEMERQRLMPTPEAPKPMPPLAPPTASGSADEEQAAADARRKSLKRTAPGRSTIFAGESYGSQLGGRKTILG